MKSISELLSTMETGYDTTFELNEFGEPRIRSEIETVKDMLMFILFAKPGQYPSLPNIGIDINSMLYSFYDEISIDKLMEDICTQCEALRPYFNNGSIAMKKTMYKNQPSLLINVQGTETYPDGYLRDSVDETHKYLIGITFDELNRMVFNINTM